MRYTGIGILPAVAGRLQAADGPEYAAIITHLQQQALRLVIITAANDKAAAGKGFAERILYPAGFIAAKGFFGIFFREKLGVYAGFAGSYQRRLVYRRLFFTTRCGESIYG